MRESILKEFFDGNVDAKTLASDLQGSMITTGTITRHPIETMTETFRVWPEHLTLACDAVLRGDIDPKDLQAIGFCITASENFVYDIDAPEGDLVDWVATMWSACEINYPLTRDNVRKFREWLLTGADPFTISDATEQLGYESRSQAQRSPLQPKS